MLAWMLRLTGCVLLIDTLIVSFGVSVWGVAGVLPTLACFFVARRLKPTRSSARITGWDIGQGVDLENPDLCKNTHVVLEDKALDLGVLAIGGPGSGKSIMAIGKLLYFTANRPGGWVYWEGKGDLEIYQKAVACGAKPDHFFSSELPDSDTTNVLNGEVDSVIDRISRALIASESEYYGNAQRSALRRVVPLLKALNVPVALRDLYVMLILPEAGRYVMNLARERGVKADVIESARQFFAIDDKDRMSQIHGLLNRMDLFVTGRIADRLNAYQPTLDLATAAKQGLKIYMHLPYTQMARDIAIMLTEEIGSIATQRQLFDRNRIAWPQIYDDWGAFFYENFGPITSRCRSAKMPVSFLFQSRGQTDRVDGNRIFTTEITDNIGGMVILRINGQDTAEWAARQFGTYETREISLNTGTNSEHMQTLEKPRVRSDQLKNLNAGEAYISCLIAGEHGQLDNKYYKVRFPLPDTQGSDAIDWPTIAGIHRNDDVEGLHLWRNFMDRDRLSALKEELVSAAESADTVPLKKSRKLPTKTLKDVDFL